MMYEPLMTLRLAHDYFEGPPPLRAALRAPLATGADIARAGLLVRQAPAGLSLWITAGEVRPATLEFEIRATDPAILRVTPAMAAEGVSAITLEPGPGASEHRVAPGNLGETPGSDDDVRRALLWLSVTLPEGGAPDLRLVLPAAEAIWAYHILGRSDDGLSIVDAAGEVRFDAAGPTTLPDGRIAQSYRSDRPVALRARAQARFSLMRDSPFGPQTLIEGLPGAGAVTSYATQSATASATSRGASARMQSDIYVTL